MYGEYILWDHFAPSFSTQYILVAMDYLSKWVEVVALPSNDATSVLNFM